MALEFLKEIYGDKALTYAEIEAAIKDNDKIKPVNLADGGYVGKEKFDAKVAELNTANSTITALKDSAKKFEGVDVEALKNRITAAQQKYDADIQKVRFDHALELALRDGKARNTKAVRALLDLDKIKLEGDKLSGLTEQLEELRKSDSYQFIDDSGNISGGTGKSDPGTPPNTKDPATMTMDEYIAFRKGQN